MYEHAHWDYIVCPRYTFCVCDLGNPFPSRGLGFYIDDVEWSSNCPAVQQLVQGETC